MRAAVFLAVSFGTAFAIPLNDSPSKSVANMISTPTPTPRTMTDLKSITTSSTPTSVSTPVSTMSGSLNTTDTALPNDLDLTDASDGGGSDDIAYTMSPWEAAEMYAALLLWSLNEDDRQMIMASNLTRPQIDYIIAGPPSSTPEASRDRTNDRAILYTGLSEIDPTWTLAVVDPIITGIDWWKRDVKSAQAPGPVGRGEQERCQNGTGDVGGFGGNAMGDHGLTGPGGNAMGGPGIGGPAGNAMGDHGMGGSGGGALGSNAMGDHGIGGPGGNAMGDHGMGGPAGNAMGDHGMGVPGGNEMGDHGTGGPGGNAMGDHGTGGPGGNAMGDHGLGGPGGNEMGDHGIGSPAGNAMGDHGTGVPGGNAQGGNAMGGPGMGGPGGNTMGDHGMGGSGGSEMGDHSTGGPGGNAMGGPGMGGPGGNTMGDHGMGGSGGSEMGDHSTGGPGGNAMSDHGTEGPGGNALGGHEMKNSIPSLTPAPSLNMMQTPIQTPIPMPTSTSHELGGHEMKKSIPSLTPAPSLNIMQSPMQTPIPTPTSIVSAVTKNLTGIADTNNITDTSRANAKQEIALNTTTPVDQPCEDEVAKVQPVTSDECDEANDSVKPPNEKDDKKGDEKDDKKDKKKDDDKDKKKEDDKDKKKEDKNSTSAAAIDAAAGAANTPVNAPVNKTVLTTVPKDAVPIVPGTEQVAANAAAEANAASSTTVTINLINGQPYVVPVSSEAGHVDHDVLGAVAAVANASACADKEAGSGDLTTTVSAFNPALETQTDKAPQMIQGKNVTITQQQQQPPQSSSQPKESASVAGTTAVATETTEPGTSTETEAEDSAETVATSGTGGSSTSGLPKFDADGTSRSTALPIADSNTAYTVHVGGSAGTVLVMLAAAAAIL
ncbi:hypothetical protein PYCC9005_004747 [Savitreella phatthalungensis]